MRRVSLRFQVFLAILGVSLGTAAVVGIAARSALSAAFDVYLASLPAGMGMRGRPRMGRMMLGAAEQAFVAGVDRGVLTAAAVAVVVAAAVALALAAYLARPLRRLEAAANALAEGDLTHRVEIDGPVEVASLGETFNLMADSLERAEKLRRRLSADIAHELRNPLAAARAQAEGMADLVIACDEERLASLVEDLAHLSALVDDLQELAVADAGGLRYEMAPVDIAALAAAEADRVRATISEHIRLAVDLPDAPVMIEGDERRLAQVLRNLLSNAVQHTSDGTITVSARVEGAEAVVAVTDTGEGVPAEDLAHIFERFYRADSARAKGKGGTGLGLAISRQIVRDHGGEVFAASRPGEGASVGFRIPLGG